MEFRVLKYFLAVAREKNITKAADRLHLTQPTLSRQLRDLEEELGCPLFIRGTRKITLTEEGYLLQKRAAQILELTDKTAMDLHLIKKHISGDVRIGAGESELFRYVAQSASTIHQRYPDIRFHIISGDGINVLEQLERGLLDFGLIFQPFDSSVYESLLLPETQKWGVLMRSDSPLSKKDYVESRDLWDKPLIVSRTEFGTKISEQWMGLPTEKTNIVATYSLLFNASLLVEEGLGYAICFNHILNVEGNERLCFRTFKDTGQTMAHIIWKKHQSFNKASIVFLDELKKSIPID